MPVNTEKSSGFLILGTEFERERVRFTTADGPTSPRWRLHVRLSLRSVDGRGSSEDSMPCGLGPLGCVGIGCQAAADASAPQPAAGAPAAASPAVRQTAPAAVSGCQVGCSRWSAGAVPATDSGYGASPIPAGSRRGHGLELEELDQQHDRNDRDRLRHDGGKHPENRGRLRGKAQQRETEAKQHSERPGDQAEDA